jgi:hypothetical protein
MSCRTLVALAASIVISFGCLATISTDALARAAPITGGAVAHHGGAYSGPSAGRGVAVGVGAAAAARR